MLSSSCLRGCIIREREDTPAYLLQHHNLRLSTANPAASPDVVCDKSRPDGGSRSFSQTAVWHNSLRLTASTPPCGPMPGAVQRRTPRPGKHAMHGGSRRPQFVWLARLSPIAVHWTGVTLPSKEFFLLRQLVITDTLHSHRTPGILRSKCQKGAKENHHLCFCVSRAQ